jgi:hypothetical protein
MTNILHVKPKLMMTWNFIIIKKILIIKMIGFCVTTLTLVSRLTVEHKGT